MRHYIPSLFLTVPKSWRALFTSFWLPLGRKLLRLGDLRGSHLSGNKVAVVNRFVTGLFLRNRIGGGGSEVEPHMRLDVVLRHAIAVGVHLAEDGLRSGRALVGGPAVPHHSFGVILRDDLAEVIHGAEIELHADRSRSWARWRA